jgi:hypothetical protein
MPITCRFIPGLNDRLVPKLAYFTLIENGCYLAAVIEI